MNNNLSLDQIQQYIDKYHETHDSVGDLSDGYHTFNELYKHRSMLFLSLCLTAFRDRAWKSLSHEIGGDPMYSGMFIMGIDTPYGQATYHFDIDPYWKLSRGVKELDNAPKFDGHTPDEAIDRIYRYAAFLNTPAFRTADIFGTTKGLKGLI